MRDPAVRAIYAIRVTLDEWKAMKSGCMSLRRKTWPVKAIAPGSVVGLAVGGEVWGEALIIAARAAVDGGHVFCEWQFAFLDEFLSVCPVRFGRGIVASFEAPHGTLTPPRGV